MKRDREYWRTHWRDVVQTGPAPPKTLARLKRRVLTGKWDGEVEATEDSSHS